MRHYAQRSAGWQQTALYIAGFFAAWQIVDLATRVIFGAGISSVYPVMAVDVLFLIYVGWRWWPLIPVNEVIHWFFVSRHQHGPWVALIIQLSVAIVLALAVRYVLTTKRVMLPLRNLHDVALFAGVVGIAAPVVAAFASLTLLVAANLVAVDQIAEEALRFIVADVTATMAIVPAIVTFAGWKKFMPPIDRSEPKPLEIGLLVAAAFSIVAAGIYLASLTHEPALDLAFVPVAWLAIRYGVRGAALMSATLYVSVTLMQIVLHMPQDLLLETQGLLFASSLMALLLAGVVEDRWMLTARVARRAFIDDLTSLPNRDRLSEWIAAHADSAIVMVLLDIDDMRLLNQGIGRVAADRVLQQMALRLRGAFPPSYMVARVSADEFAVAVVDDRSPHAIMAELRHFFDAPFEADSSRVYLTVSMGAVRQLRGGSADDMLRKADVALEYAKNSPVHAIVFSPELQLSESRSLVGELHRAVEHRELVPFFQPIFHYDERTGTWQVIGAEALLRWIHPERGVIVPANFLDMLDRLAIGEVVNWNMMELALLQAGEWRRDFPDFQVWVNLSARQVLQHQCRDRIRELLERTAVPPSALLVEINEGVIAADEGDVAELVSGLREIGVSSAIDDFGTGGSSLGRVRDVPASVLKIDRSFVMKSEIDAKARAVAVTVMRLGAELGMTVVAEGVENAMQLEVMLETGCRYVQGYALGHPLPAELFARTFLSLGRASSL